MAFLACQAPHALACVLAGRNYDLATPRTTIEHCAKDASMDKEVRVAPRCRPGGRPGRQRKAERPRLTRPKRSGAR